MLGQQPQKGLMVVCTGRGMWTGKEEATTAPGGAGCVTHRDRIYRTSAQSHRKSQAAYLSVRFCRTARGMCPESK